MKESLRLRAEALLGNPEGNGKTLYGKRYLDSGLRRVAVDAPVAVGLLPLAIGATTILGPLVCLQNGGPPIVDVGRYVDGNGKRVPEYKIRTMIPNAQGLELEFVRSRGVECLTEAKAGSDDSRITPLGRHLRRFSLDEFPQGFNLMLGHLTSIGPRYLSVTDTEVIRRESDTDPYRTFLNNLNCGLKFGVTGICVALARDSRDLSEKLELENMYVDRSNLAADIKILGLTLRELGRASGR